MDFKRLSTMTKFEANLYYRKTGVMNDRMWNSLKEDPLFYQWLEMREGKVGAAAL